jgi:hypothetical protein
MTYLPYSDQHRQTITSIRIDFVGIDVTKYVVFSETSFEAIGSAQPGTCRITLRGVPAVIALLESGSSIVLTIDGEIYWQGYVTLITRTYFFPDKTTPKVIIEGVDLNILFDRLVLYNHRNPVKWPTGGETYIKSETGLTDGEVPNPTPDRLFLIACLKDTDLNLITPRIKTNLIREIGAMTSTEDTEKAASTPSAGASMRALFEETAGFVGASRGQSGSVIYYIDAKGQLVYRNVDDGDAPFTVSDDGSTDVACRELEIVRDASHLKNDVLVFAGELNPSPDSDQTMFKYAHRYSASSIAKYGRFQYAETVGAWSGTMTGARARKILDQERTPGLRVSFSIYRPGLIPGMLVDITSTEFGISEKVPVRSVRISFETPNLAKYTVMCSYDTNDPWGILLAVKRPASRGLIPPRVQPMRLTPGQDVPHADYYTSVEEIPHGLGGGWYQCSYQYIRHSLIVYIDSKKGNRVPNTAGYSTVTDYIEKDPTKGKFFTEATGRIWVSYHVAGNL